MQLDHWGIPWTRDENGHIEQRPFGGHSYPRATLAADKTGFFEMQTLYDTLLKYKNFSRYDELFITDILIEDGSFQGLVGIDATSGETIAMRGKALMIASGGAGTLYGFTTYSQSVTGDGLAMAYRAGLPLEDMEFLQFHPTGLVPSGILMTEGCRGEGGFLRNANGERFLENYAPEKMELGPRDVISRAEMTEILEGRGFEGEDGFDYLHLDLTHLGEEKINTRLPLIREVAMKFKGVDPIKQPIPIRPVAHYSMGGIETDIDGATRVPGIWAAGEAACVSLHGANRLGSNSTAECLVWGAIAGAEMARGLDTLPTPRPLSASQLSEAKERIDGLLARQGEENMYELRARLRSAMDKHVGVYRTGEGLSEALATIREIRQRAKNAPVTDKSQIYNSNLYHALELENLIDLAEVTVMGALAREESRGAHSRRDFTTRDDENWLRHTLVWKTDSEPRLDEKPVTITTWKPVERKY
jgi:succinate dehydrogenase / fumarate reductase flavoprotein subunit